MWGALYRWIDRQDWLEPAGEATQQVVLTAYSAAGPLGQRAKDFLHGTWFGHPLHPALVALPLGAWTAAAILDLLDMLGGDEQLGRNADAAIGLGVLGALGAAVAGATDWSATDPPARRLGLVHGALNGGIAAAYAASFALRRGGARNAGRTLSLLAWTASFVSAHLGGELVYGRGIGVNHAVASEPTDWTAVLDEAALPENSPQQVEAGGIPVVVLRQNGRLHALLDTCAHLGGPLSEGEVGDGCITCPWHGSTYALDDGRILTGPSAFPQPVLETRIREGRIEVRATATA